jgi:transcriptional regulator with XRE-family HTH domain
MGETAPPKRTFAEKLDRLFRTVHPAGRGAYSYNEVAAGIRERGAASISPQYLWLLRRGERDNPTIQHLEAIADFFGVPAAYFLDDEKAAKVDQELAAVVALRDSSVRQVALRAAGLSPQSLDAIQEMIDQVRRLEGLAQPSPDDPPR